MAYEITLSASLRCQKPSSGIDLSLDILGAVFDLAGDSALHFFQSVGTSEEALELGQDIGTPGFVLVRNLDTTNYVSFRRASGEGNFLKVRAKGVALFELETTAPYVIANTATVRIECLLLEA